MSITVKLTICRFKINGKKLEISRTREKTSLTKEEISENKIEAIIGDMFVVFDDILWISYSWNQQTNDYFEGEGDILYSEDYRLLDPDD